MLGQLMSFFPRRREGKLIRAAEDGRLDIVQSLLEAGVSPNARGDGEVTVLMWAAARGHIEVVRLLLQAGADPKAQTRKGRTAVELAQQQGNDAVAALLQEPLPRDLQARRC